MENELTFTLGPVVIGISLITTWGIMLVITLIAWLSTRHLDMLPDTLQTTAEGIVAVIDEALPPSHRNMEGKSCLLFLRFGCF